jgi:hypothetical protein
MHKPCATGKAGYEGVPSRAEQRRVRRDGREPPMVRGVRIRHPENRPAPDGTGDRAYATRWTVRGHWRRQWYPNRGEHRPVWINPHIKGPDGAPLTHGQTVHLLDRTGHPAASDQPPELPSDEH